MPSTPIRAVDSRVVPAPVERVWAVLADGWLVWVLDRVMSLSEAHSAPMRDVLLALANRVG